MEGGETEWVDEILGELFEWVIETLSDSEEEVGDQQENRTKQEEPALSMEDNINSVEE